MDKNKEYYTDAQKKATLKYMSKTVSIQVRVDKNKRDSYHDLAEKRGISLAKLIVNLLDEELEKDKI